MNAPGRKLIAAIDAAQRDARPLFASEIGGTQRGRDPSDPREPWWYFPPSPVLHGEIRRLCTKHGLVIILLSEATGAKGQVCTRWLVAHVETGESMEIGWEAPPMPDLATGTHGVAATVQHTSGYMPRVLFSIAVRRTIHQHEEVIDGCIVRRAGAPEFEPSSEQLELDKMVGEEPGWMNPRARAPDPDTGGGLVDPGPLGGEDDGGEAERAALADDADAAALSGKGPEVVDEHALWTALKAWGVEHNSAPRTRTGDALVAAHDGDERVRQLPITGTPAALGRRERLIAFLRAGGFLP